MAYTPTEWSNNNPKLTPELMNKLENGVAAASAKADLTEEEVDEINSNLSDNEFDLKANTFVDSKIINSSGVETTAGGWKASDYVLISSTITEMIFTFEASGETTSLAFYDENKNVLLAKPYDGNKIIKVTVPPKSKYFRYTVNITASTHSVKGYGITRVVKQQNESLDGYYTEFDKLRVLVPFSIKSGESFTVSTQDGSNFTPAKIGFYDENETEMENWDLAGYGSNKRTITYNKATAYYVSIYGGSAQKCRIVKSNNDLSRQLSNTQYAVGNIKNDLDKLNSLPKGSIIQIDADKDDIETTTQKYGWQYLGTSNIQYENGSLTLLVTNVYRKNN